MTSRNDAVFAAIRAFNPKWNNFKDEYAKLVLDALSVDEALDGFLSQSEYPDISPYTRLWATSKRLLKLDFDKPTFGQAKLVSVVEYPYSTIESVAYSSVNGRWLSSGSASISISRHGSWTTFALPTTFGRGLIKEFVELIRSHLSSPEPSGNQNALSSSSSDPLANLERLVQMKFQGLLTEEEFKAAKAKLLGL